MSAPRMVPNVTETMPVLSMPNRTLDGNAILTVSQFEEDLATLRRIFSHSKWKLYQCHSCNEALGLLHHTAVPIVIADRGAPGGGWKRLAHECRHLTPAPKLIVAHRFSEAHTMGHTLKEGAYHAIAKPFNKGEVFQSVGFAWQQWKREQGKASGPAMAGFSAGG